MTLALENIVDNSVHFSTELNDLTYTPDVTGEGILSVRWYYTYDTNSTPLILPIKAVKGEKIHFTGFGNIFRDYLINADPETTPTGTFWIIIEIGGSTFNKPIAVIPHYGKKHLKAQDFVGKSFFNDCKVTLLPDVSENNGPGILPRFYFSSGDYLVRIEGSATRTNLYGTKPEGFSANRIGYPLIVYKDFRDLNKTYLFFRIRAYNSNSVLLEGVRDLQIWRIPPTEGFGFIFRNSYGLAEYVFIPGVISEKQEKTSTEVNASGSIREVDVDVKDSISIKVDAAPDWLVDNARALLNSRCVFMLDDPYNFQMDSMRIYEHNVIISELTGNISRDPSKLSDFTLTFKRTDI